MIPAWPLPTRGGKQLGSVGSFGLARSFLCSGISWTSGFLLRLSLGNQRASFLLGDMLKLRKVINNTVEKWRWYLHISLSIQGAIGDSTATAGFLGLRLDTSKCEDFFLFHNLSMMLLLGSPNSSKKNHTNVNSNLRSEMLRAVLESIAFSQKQLVRKHLVDFVIYKVRSRLKHLEKVYASKFLT